MTWTVRWRIGAASATLPVALWCCQVIGGFEGYEVTPAPPGAGGSGTGGSAMGGGGAVNGLCALATPPPVNPNADIGGNLDIVLAVRALRLGEDLTMEGGVDLDDRCTCQDLAICECAPQDCPCAQQGGTCGRPPALPVAADWVACDEANGVDASSKRLFNRVNSAYPNLSSEAMSLSIETGYWSVLLRVQGYNGQPNDKQVTVSFYTSGPKILDGCDTTPPKWDGNDRWPIDRKSVVDPISCDGGTAVPVVIDQFGYVVDGQVVAKLNRATLFIAVATVPLPFRLQDVKVMMPLREDDDGVWRMENGVISGKWATTDAFDAIATLDTVPGVSLCGDSSIKFVQDTVCAYPDLRLGAPDEAQPCDAISFFAEIDAVQARIGRTIDVPLTPPECPTLAILDCITPYTP